MTTQYAEASYQEIIDLHTESDTVSVVGIHTPQGVNPRRMLKGFFQQFKRFRYDGCSLSLVPAARLPADPSQVSYGAGEPPIDPRDLLNPILWHGCHGNDMGQILNSLYSGENTGTNEIDRMITDSISFDVLSESRLGNDYVDALYYKALTDNTWAKAHPQRGFRKSGLTPMVYSLATNFQFASSSSPSGYGFPQPNGSERVSSGAFNGDPQSISNDQIGFGSSATAPTFEQVPSLPTTSGSGASDIAVYRLSNRQSIQLFTPRLQRLGWLDTYSVAGNGNAVTFTASGLTGETESDSRIVGNAISDADVLKLREVQLPRIYMGMLMLPPAYKTEQYFRLILNHHYSFSKFRGMSSMSDNTWEVNHAPTYTNFN